MNFKFGKWIIKIIIVSVLMNITYAWGKPVIRLAILDNPKGNVDNPIISKNLENAYIQGINTAVIAARSKGYDVKYKLFFYGNNLLEILKMINQVKAWKPDAVVGLHNSNQLLVTKRFLKNIMVISLFASDKNVDFLPNTFHSLGIPDQELVGIFMQFVTKKFPKKNIFLVVEADNKETMDMAKMFTIEMKKYHPKISVHQEDYIQNDFKILDLKKFLHAYSPPSVILVLSIDYYTSAFVMSKITNYLHDKKVSFITAVDNWSNDRAPTGSLSYYKGYRVTPFLMNLKEANFLKFYKVFYHHYKNSPKYQISYSTYNAVFSIIKALECYPNNSKDIRKRVLKSYQDAIINNPNWFRPHQFGVYKMTPGKEELIPGFYLINGDDKNNYACMGT